MRIFFLLLLLTSCALEEKNPDWLDSLLELNEKVVEAPGNEENEWIQRAFAITGTPVEKRKDSTTGWCAAAMNAVLYENGYKISTGLAKDFISYGYATSPKRGAIVVTLIDGQYHVTCLVDGEIILNKGVEYYRCIGGNQSNQIKIVAYKKKDIIAYRWAVKKIKEYKS
jgi:uncharacterized protein (TIGR02594 family)